MTGAGRRRGELLLWAVVFVVAAAWLAVVEVFWTPLRIGPVPLPLSVAAAIGGNLLLVTGAYRLTGSRVVALLPAVVWLVVAAGAAIRRPEGDLLLVGGGASGIANLAFLLLGVLAAAFAVGRVLAAPRGVRTTEADAPTDSDTRTARRNADDGRRGPAASGAGRRVILSARKIVRRAPDPAGVPREEPP